MSVEEKGEHSPGHTSPAASILHPQLVSSENEEGKDRDSNVIDFEGPDDPLNALNWPFRKKVVVTMLYSFCTMGATWASTA